MQNSIEKLGTLTANLIETRGQELQHLVDTSECLFCIARDDGYFIFVNPAWKKSLGYGADILTSRPWLSFVHDEDKKSTTLAAEEMKIRDVIGFENRYQARDGSWRKLKWTALRWNEAGITYAIAEDLTKNGK